ncbi:hypothetical protein HBHAL_2701 [Halobacillus halophilus DSM 2266]|uniref:Uncharacterized protein n=1 Tax=Halobacillus halophilus (strain ATCC 35676 / DSM 2266 / JCM 20832 / KCTC 3685 / LMG 17431 / NBRC 102448 / NCIMB 2269) TaxID=866895 RepID=I0JLN1_HALH3|nr:hypothetical protein HBHAL_2701 [Halobacillus halophilus DSM 2266]
MGRRLWKDFRALHKRKGAEGNGEDSCGMNMIGEIPEGVA